MEVDRDDFFSDDSNDALPLEDILQLERGLARDTQESIPPARSIAIPAPPSLRRHGTSNLSISLSQYPQPPASFDEFEDSGDVDVIDGQDTTVLEDVYRHGRPRGSAWKLDSNRATTNQCDAVEQNEGGQGLQTDNEDTRLMRYLGEDSFATTTYEPTELDSLKERIETLSRERERTLQELNAAKAMSETRAGEIAIIRANKMKLEKSYIQQMDALRNTMSEESKKYLAEIQSVLMETKRLTTENAFLKQDIKEELGRTNKLQQTLKSKSKEDGDPTTPKKSRSLPLRDGFDDDEIMASPTKSLGRKSKRGTPSTSNKRKRAIDDSPIPAPLQLTKSFDPGVESFPTPTAVPEIDTGPQKPKGRDRNQYYMRSILNHRSCPGKPTDIDLLSALAFPSAHTPRFSTIVIERVVSGPSGNYAVDYAKAVAYLLGRACKKKFYRPVGLLMAIIKYILHLDLNILAPLLIEDLVPVLQDCGTINGAPRFRRSPACRKQLEPPQRHLDQQVSSTEALEILHLILSGCQHDQEALHRFCRALSYDFTLMMINSHQKLNDIMLILKLLSYSQLPDSLGPISDAKSQQVYLEDIRQLKTILGPIPDSDALQILGEDAIIDRATALLSQPLVPDDGEPPYTNREICTLRVEVMSFLLEIVFSGPRTAQNRICKRIASHPIALARIFRSMHDELDTQYSNPPEHDLHATMINGLTRLAHAVITLFPDLVDLPGQLRTVPGAVQKHLVVLTRLAFSDGMLLEAGIHDDTVDMAHELLEGAVNPQEAEALLDAFRSKSCEGA
ncbi:hypothetical protein FQN57_001155 [Myotisia sp. PD_48]|nr:hypothetical protein FQN57_001155 [Myotisia sp. PD_48]